MSTNSLFIEYFSHLEELDFPFECGWFLWLDSLTECNGCGFLWLLMLDHKKPLKAPGPLGMLASRDAPFGILALNSVMLWGNLSSFERELYGEESKPPTDSVKPFPNQQQHQFFLHGGSSLGNGSSSLSQAASGMATWIRDSTAQLVGYWEQLVIIVVVD